MIKQWIQVLVIFSLLMCSGLLYAAEKYEFVTMWPERQWFCPQPSDIAVDEENNVYAINYEPSLFPAVMKFDKKGSFIAGWGNYGNKEGEFDNPSSIIADKGFVYIADTKKVQKFTSEGKFVSCWWKANDNPNKLVVDSKGNIYVNCNSGWYELTADCVLIAKLDVHGEVFILDAKDNVWAATNEDIRKYDKHGKLIQVIKILNEDDNFRGAIEIVVDQKGYIYLVCAYKVGRYDSSLSVKKFDPNGVFLFEVFEDGSRYGEMDNSKDTGDISINSSGYIQLLDTGDQYIKKFNQKQKILAQWKNSPGLIEPREIIIDNSDNIFVNLVHKFSPEGDHIADLQIDEELLGSLTVDADAVVYCLPGNMETVGASTTVYQSTTITRVSFSPLKVYSKIPLQLSRRYNIDSMLVDTMKNIILLANPLEGETDDILEDENGLVSYNQYDIADEYLLLKINEKGEIIWKKEFGKEVYFISSFVVDKMGNIYLGVESPAHESKIYKYSKDAVRLKTIDCKESKLRIGRLAVDGKGNIYATDWDNNRVLKLDAEGNEIARWGIAGLGKGEFNHPTGIGVDSQGNVYVADTDNHRVQKFAPVH